MLSLAVFAALAGCDGRRSDVPIPRVSPSVAARVTASATSLPAASDGIPASSTAAVLPSSVQQLQAWQRSLAEQDATAARSADALREQLHMLGLRKLLDNAVRDSSRSTGCVAPGCDALCHEALLQCRLALGEHVAAAACAALSGVAGDATPQRHSKSARAAQEVVSPFMLAVE